MADMMTIAQQKQRALEWAQGFAAASGLEVEAALARDEPESVLIAFDGPDARYLIGRSGQALDALQLLATFALGRTAGGRLHILFDADGYRLRREQMLINLAREIAEQVRASGEEAVLDPLSPLERRIVHRALTEEAGIRTYSEGEDPHRYIVIAPAG